MKQFDTHTDEMQVSEDYKPTYIQEQHNNNCQQFFGPITNCTFTMPAVSQSSSKKPKSSKPQKESKSKPSGKPKTLKYYMHGNNGILMKQRKRVDIVFRKWNEWGWIDDSTSPDDFDAFFEGEPRHCNIAWMTNTTILTILMQELLKQPYIEKQTGCSAKSLVEHQFEKTPNSDKTRLDKDAKLKMETTLYILDIANPLPLKEGSRDDDYDTRDVAFQAVLSGLLRTTKGI